MQKTCKSIKKYDIKKYKKICFYCMIIANAKSMQKNNKTKKI